MRNYQTISIEDLRTYLDNNKVGNRSAWGRGVTTYAHEILDTLEDIYGATISTNITREELLKSALNGAETWEQYSWGGCSLIYDCDIAETLCSPSELKKCKGGERRPNAQEEWLDTQARALKQAFKRICIARINFYR